MASIGESSAATGQGSNVFTRLLLVLTSPAAAYAEVAARPKVLGALAVVIAISMLCQFIFLSTEVGQQVLVDQQISGVEAFGTTVTPEIEQRLQARVGIARFTSPAMQAVAIPIMAAILAGILLVIFNATSDSPSTFKHVYAIVAHSGAVTVVQQIVLTPISYLMGEFATVTRLSVFFPMLDSDGFLAHVLGGIELFMVWWLVNLSIGIAVLYRRPTRAVAITILSIYVAIVVIVAVIRAVI